jgi:hypothetical protein
VVLGDSTGKKCPLGATAILSAIVRLFNLFTAYLHHITKEMLIKNSMLIVGKAVINKNGEAKQNLTLSLADCQNGKL